MIMSVLSICMFNCVMLTSTINGVLEVFGFTGQLKLAVYVNHGLLTVHGE